MFAADFCLRWHVQGHLKTTQQPMPALPTLAGTMAGGQANRSCFPMFQPLKACSSAYQEVSCISRLHFARILVPTILCPHQHLGLVASIICPCQSLASRKGHCALDAGGNIRHTLRRRGESFCWPQYFLHFCMGLVGAYCAQW